MIDHDTRKRHVEDFLYMTEPARWLSERDRDYKDNKQWTVERDAVLRSRGQAPVVNNRVKPKVEGLKGLYIQRKTDIKAYARTKAHEESSEAATDGLRYVGDNSDMDSIELAVFDNQIVEGYGGAIIDIEVKGDEVEIKPVQIPWDRIYFDPHSRRLDFKDATYMGIVLWMDHEQAEQMFPKAKAVLELAVTEADLYETFEDRPRWREVSGRRKRIRLAHEFYLEDGKWMECVFTGSGDVVKPRESTYQDEDGNPTNPIELVGAYIDRDNNRFGEVRYWIDQQDEINYRHSKFLHLLSTRQTYAMKGTFSDVEQAKRELAKPNGHIETQGKFGEDWGLLQTADMADAQFMMLQEAKKEMDSVSFNAQLSGERQGDLSGVAVQSLQMAGMLEVNSLFNEMVGWKKRVYRQIWCRIKQHWTKEKWIRVTDDYGKLRWVGINTPITRQQMMEEFIKDESQPLPERQQAAQLLQVVAQQQPQALQEVMETKNPIPELDMDIILELSTNSINVQQEQFRILAELAASRPQEVPFKSLLKLSELRDKDDLIKDIEQREQAAMQAQSELAQLDKTERVVSIQGKQMDNQKKAVEVEKIGAEVVKTNMDSISKQIENVNMQMYPDTSPQQVA